MNYIFSFKLVAQSYLGKIYKLQKTINDIFQISSNGCFFWRGEGRVNFKCWSKDFEISI